ncbi:hypothetical protein KA531_01985 [Candidatus Saccharibacteria bacterium]|nr:hypothetical protein [Candidatus Saccharibacteria bacterium]
MSQEIIGSNESYDRVGWPTMCHIEVSIGEFRKNLAVQTSHGIIGNMGLTANQIEGVFDWIEKDFGNKRTYLRKAMKGSSDQWIEHCDQLTGSNRYNDNNLPDPAHIEGEYTLAKVICASLEAALVYPGEYEGMGMFKLYLDRINNMSRYSGSLSDKDIQMVRIQFRSWLEEYRQVIRPILVSILGRYSVILKNQLHDIILDRGLDIDRAKSWFSYQVEQYVSGLPYDISLEDLEGWEELIKILHEEVMAGEGKLLLGKYLEFGGKFAKPVSRLSSLGINSELVEEQIRDERELLGRYLSSGEFYMLSRHCGFPRNDVGDPDLANLARCFLEERDKINELLAKYGTQLPIPENSQIREIARILSVNEGSLASQLDQYKKTDPSSSIQNRVSAQNERLHDLAQSTFRDFDLNPTDARTMLGNLKQADRNTILGEWLIMCEDLDSMIPKILNFFNFNSDEADELLSEEAKSIIQARFAELIDVLNLFFDEHYINSLGLAVEIANNDLDRLRYFDRLIPIPSIAERYNSMYGESFFESNESIDNDKVRQACIVRYGSEVWSHLVRCLNDRTIAGLTDPEYFLERGGCEKFNSVSWKDLEWLQDNLEYKDRVDIPATIKTVVVNCLDLDKVTLEKFEEAVGTGMTLFDDRTDIDPLKIAESLLELGFKGYKITELMEVVGFRVRMLDGKFSIINITSHS